MEAKNIGTARIEYNKNGQALSASFTPEMEVHLAPNALIQLTNIKGDQQEIERNASLVMASWFERTNEIELADRDEYQITPRTVLCEKYKSGQIKTCVIAFSLERVNQTA